MPEYIELSAKANVDFAADIMSNDTEGNKVKPYYVNEEFQGYLIRSPKSGRIIFVSKDIGFNGNYEIPTFEMGITAMAQNGYPEEHFLIILGQVIYVKKCENGVDEVVEQMPMIAVDKEG